MYEKIISFLLGKKKEFTVDDLEQFISLLIKGLDIDEEYDVLRKQAIIDNMVKEAHMENEDEEKQLNTSLNNVLLTREDMDFFNLHPDKLLNFKIGVDTNATKEVKKSSLKNIKISRGKKRVKKEEEVADESAESQTLSSGYEDDRDVFEIAIEVVDLKQKQKEETSDGTGNDINNGDTGDIKNIETPTIGSESKEKDTIDLKDSGDKKTVKVENTKCLFKASSEESSGIEKNEYGFKFDIREIVNEIEKRKGSKESCTDDEETDSGSSEFKFKVDT